MVPIPEVRLAVSAGGQDFSLAAWHRDTGSEELVVWVHGLACSRQSFAEAWRRPELRDLSLLAFDLPGFGRSPAPAQFGYDLLEQARVLQAVLDARASRRILLVAHSMGGTLTLLLPPRVLARLGALVLVEARLLAASSTVSAEAAGYDFEAFRRKFLPRFRARIANDPGQSFDLDRADPLAFYRSALSLGDWARKGGLPDRFAQAGCPRWFVWGEQNAHLGELAILPPEQLVMIPRAAHFPMQDNPDLFYPTLAGLLGAGSA